MEKRDGAVVLVSPLKMAQAPSPSPPLQRSAFATTNFFTLTFRARASANFFTLTFRALGRYHAAGRPPWQVQLESEPKPVSQPRSQPCQSRLASPSRCLRNGHLGRLVRSQSPGQFPSPVPNPASPASLTRPGVSRCGSYGQNVVRAAHAQCGF